MKFWGASKYKPIWSQYKPKNQFLFITILTPNEITMKDKHFLAHPPFFQQTHPHPPSLPVITTIHPNQNRHHPRRQNHLEIDAFAAITAQKNAEISTSNRFACCSSSPPDVRVPTRNRELQRCNHVLDSWCVNC